MYLGVDLGTSGIKIIITNQNGDLIDSASAPLEVSRPQPLFSEQAPADWWQAFNSAMHDLSVREHLAQVKGIGLSGQMHGAVTIDENDEVIRPAILWNDGRSAAQCKELEALVANSQEITGNLIMPGFTAPKLLWMKQHEPDNFSRIAKVLLPKDYLRLLMTSADSPARYASDMSDSAGTLWLNTRTRSWDASILAACGLSVANMPTLFEGSEITGYFDAELANKWGMQTNIPIIAGGGDNAAGAVGVGLIKPGQGMLSLGTSGVYFVVADKYSAKPGLAVHSFCHALPDRWHLMSVVLSAASCLQWFADVIVEQDLTSLMSQLDEHKADNSSPYFLPYLSGERTPHNNPNAQGAFFGLTHSTTKLSMLHAVLEGVSFAFADGVDALHASGTKATEITLIGGGTKSDYWRQMLADVLGLNLTYRAGGDVGPALGAARLAQIAIEPERNIADICAQPELVGTYQPKIEKSKYYSRRRAKFQQLYTSTKDLF
jgi:xylulokinase